MFNQLIIILYTAHLGFGKHTSWSNLAKANKNCDYHIFKTECYY